MKIKFRAISPDGRIYVSDNQLQFAKEHGLHRSDINSCLRGRLVSCGNGWRFAYADQTRMSIYDQIDIMRKDISEIKELVCALYSETKEIKHAVKEMYDAKECSIDT